jgi:phosphomannomutase
VLPALPEQRIPFSDTAKFAVVEAVRERFAPHYTVIDVDGVRVDFGDGWGVIRTSNTEPAITTRFEASSEARLHAIRDMMLDVVENVRASQPT